MRGHVRKRGRVWTFVIDVGLHLAQRCTECRKRYWVEGPRRLPSCPQCGGGDLRETEERRQRWVSGFRTKGEAESELSRLLRELDQGGDPFPPNMTLRTYATQWLDHQRTRVRPKTLQRYEQLLEHFVLPRVGSVRLAKLRPAHIQGVVDEVLASGRSPQTALHVYRTLSNALHQAVRWQLIPLNPAAAARPPRPERPKLEIPKPEQLVQLMDAARGGRWEIPVLLAATTGARRSEVLALRWRDVDLENGRIWITRSVQRVNGEAGPELRFLDVKTQRARRSVGLPKFAVARLRRHQRKQKARRLECGPAWHDLDLVSDRGDGGPLDPGEFTHAFKRIVKRANCPPAMRLHDVRHGVATAMLGQGVHPAIASAVLGHASPAFTMSVYQHVLDTMAATAAAALDEALGLQT